jgi:hypothetical protein
VKLLTSFNQVSQFRKLSELLVEKQPCTYSADEGVCTAIRTVLQGLLKLWSGKTGQGWAKAKKNEQLYVLDDIKASTERVHARIATLAHPQQSTIIFFLSNILPAQLNDTGRLWPARLPIVPWKAMSLPMHTNTW